MASALRAGRGAEISVGHDRLDACSVCAAACVPKRCGRCGKRRYCGRACQMKDWKSHKAQCLVEPANRCGVCGAGATATSPACGHGLCGACDAAHRSLPRPKATRRVVAKCPLCRGPGQAASAAILEDEVPVLLAR